MKYTSKKFKIGDIVIMSKKGIENYSVQWDPNGYGIVTDILKMKDWYRVTWYTPSHLKFDNNSYHKDDINLKEEIYEIY